MGKPILCLDFDGCIHSYKSPWEGPYIIPDPVVPGFAEWAAKAQRDFTLSIYSARSVNVRATERMQTWLRSQGIDPRQFQFPLTMPPAFLKIDDRGLLFRGDWSDPELEPELLRKFKPWNK